MLIMGKAEPFLEFFYSCSFASGEEGEARGSKMLSLNGSYPFNVRCYNFELLSY